MQDLNAYLLNINQPSVNKWNTRHFTRNQCVNQDHMLALSLIALIADLKLCLGHWGSFLRAIPDTTPLISTSLESKSLTWAPCALLRRQVWCITWVFLHSKATPSPEIRKDSLAERLKIKDLKFDWRGHSSIHQAHDIIFWPPSTRCMYNVPLLTMQLKPSWYSLIGHLATRWL